MKAFPPTKLAWWLGNFSRCHAGPIRQVREKISSRVGVDTLKSYLMGMRMVQPSIKHQSSLLHFDWVVFRESSVLTLDRVVFCESLKHLQAVQSLSLLQSISMKTILAICLAIIGLTKAMPITDSQERNHLSEFQLKNLIWSLEAISLIGQSYMKALDTPDTPISNPLMMNKIPRINLPQPSILFYPYEIRNDMKELKQEWNNFEYYKGFGPVTPRPWTYLL